VHIGAKILSFSLLVTTYFESFIHRSAMCLKRALNV